MISVEDLFRTRVEKNKHISILNTKKKNLMDRIDSINNQIEMIEAQINTITNELNAQFKSIVPNIEVTSFGLDERKRRIWGAIITFPFIDIKFYKILHEFDLFLEDIETRPVEFNNRVREVILTWLHTENDLSEYADLTPSQKNIIGECLRNIKLDRSNSLPISLQ